MCVAHQFSPSERGSFYDPDAVFEEPVYLDEEIQTYPSARADSKGIAFSEAACPTACCA